MKKVTFFTLNSNFYCVFSNIMFLFYRKKDLKKITYVGWQAAYVQRKGDLGIRDNFYKV